MKFLTFAFLCVSGPAFAGTSSWVSSAGVDTGVCPVTAPCATVQYAVNRTSPGGSVFVVDSGSYGTFSLTKAMSIIAPAGIQAVVSTTTTAARDAILVNPGSEAVVLLKGLTVLATNGQAGNFSDIEVDSGRVTIEDCVLTTGTWGIYATNPDFLLIEGNRITGTERGVENHASGRAIYLGKNVITMNEYGLLGALNSYGDNVLNGNSQCDICEATLTEVGFDQ